MKLKIVYDKESEMYELQNVMTDEVIFRSDKFKVVSKMYHDMKLREAVSDINRTLRGN